MGIPSHEPDDLLEELRRIEMAVGGQPRRLLDEVNLITGVSGGSVTASAYGLPGGRLFTEHESRLLKLDVQANLVKRAANPLN